MTLPEMIPDDLLKYASAEELDAYESSLKIERALLSPLHYMLHVSSSVAEEFPHIILLDQYLVALMDGRLYRHGPGPAPVVGEDDIPRHPVTGEEPVYRLTISMPPRHGKSFLVSEHLPPWFLTKWPEMRVILASYEAEFAASWGLKARRHVEDHADEFNVHVDDDTRAGARWNVKGHRGGLNTAGAGGPITGKGANLFIIDDPIKNAEQAFSATQRQSLDDWYQSTAFTRLEPFPDGSPGRLILMNTRWHEDDLNGRVVGREPDRWCVLNLPAMAEPTDDDPDPLGRKRGEALCPGLFTVRALTEIMESLEGGSYWWAALYQGRPNIEGGGLISRPFRYHSLRRDDDGKPGTYVATDTQGATTFIPETNCYRFATMDVAGSTKTSADWTVYSVWDLSPEGLLLLHARHRRRMATPDHEEQLREWYALYPRTRFVGIENKTFGTYLIQSAIKHGGISIRPLEADTDKIARAIPYGNAIRNGLVSFPADAEWLQEWEHEHLQFPNGSHDDQVDTGAYAVRIRDLMPVRREKSYETQTTIEKIEARVQKRGKRKRRHHPMIGRM